MEIEIFKSITIFGIKMSFWLGYTVPLFPWTPLKLKQQGVTQ